MENILIALGGALFSAACGGFVGHKLTVKLFRERSALQKKAFWCEFDLIKDSYSSSISGLIHDYEMPLKNSYSGVPGIDMTIIDSLSVELCASTEVLNLDQRRLITRLKTVLLKIQKTSQERDAVIEEWFKTENKATTFNPIRFYTAQMLLDTIQVVFYSVTVRPSHLEPMCS